MLRLGNVELETPLLLAPIAGYCDLAFRLVVRSVRGEHGGVGLACTDLLCPQAILNASTKMQWLAATCPEDRPLCMQLYGREPAIMAEAARWAAEHGAAVVDINMGCPVDKVTKKNGGARLLCEPGLAAEIVRCVVKAVPGTPVTAKIRLGWDEGSLIADTLPKALADSGIVGVTVHGRTAVQRFGGGVRIEGIARVVEVLAKSHPGVAVIGNGDVRCPEDARRMMQQTGCAGVMIGRGALGQPWIFRDTAHYVATGEVPPPTFTGSARGAGAAAFRESAAVEGRASRDRGYTPANELVFAAPAALAEPQARRAEGEVCRGVPGADGWVPGGS